MKGHSGVKSVAKYGKHTKVYQGGTATTPGGANMRIPAATAHNPAKRSK